MRRSRRFLLSSLPVLLGLVLAPSAAQTLNATSAKATTVTTLDPATNSSTTSATALNSSTTDAATTTATAAPLSPTRDSPDPAVYLVDLIRDTPRYPSVEVLELELRRVFEMALPDCGPSLPSFHLAQLRPDLVETPGVRWIVVDLRRRTSELSPCSPAPPAAEHGWLRRSDQTLAIFGSNSAIDFCPGKRAAGGLQARRRGGAAAPPGDVIQAPCDGLCLCLSHPLTHPFSSSFIFSRLSRV